MEPDPRRWQVLALVCVAFFMTVLDVSIVNVALPSIKTSLHVSENSLQWVLIAYTITFGGLLLLGGRAADLLGRRRMFMIGLVVFSGASLACGLANSIGVLVAARAVQGVGAAIISPATLAIITTTFEEGSERNKALGIWGAMGGSGAAAGVLFGGILTKYAGWEWIFFVNVPVGALVLALTRPLVRESRIAGLKGFDAAGAATITASLALLVYAISKAPEVGWASGQTIGELVGAARAPRRVRRDRDAGSRADCPVQHLPRDDRARRERLRHLPRRCRLLELLPADAVRAAGARLLGVEDRIDVPRDCGHGHPCRGACAGAGDADRCAPGTHNRLRAADGRHALVHADPDARLSSGRPYCPATSRSASASRSRSSRCRSPHSPGSRRRRRASHRD